MFRKSLIFLFSLKPFKRIIPSLIRKFSFNSKATIIFLEDFKINLFLSSSIDREIYLKNQYEKKQLDFEDLYRDAGWKVTYNTPDRDQSFKEYFKFTNGSLMYVRYSDTTLLDPVFEYEEYDSQGLILLLYSHQMEPF